MINSREPADLNRLAEKLHALHHAEEMLVIPNAWDAVSAKIFEKSGFPAIATTSSGISWSCGYQDAEHIPPELMLEVIARIARVVKVPVTADIEGGYYRNDFQKLSAFIEGVIDAGAVGINLEDGDAVSGSLNDLEHQLEKIRLVKDICRKKGVNLFLNARTDAMVMARGDMKSKIQTCIERAAAFQSAGADGIFVPFVKEMDTVIALKRGIELPLNILIANTLDVGELRRWKVNRVSIGSRPILSTLHLLRNISDEMRSGNEWSALLTVSPDYAEANAWFE
ncbi:MAG: isocitrate lyase/phosphoenolpyruvate mutase family protein [Chitinophagaceae bacterium]|nr:isocitrate lyase/phosphoenolpyruvate mutase family protein [Chitinophagaceae bacterium]